MRIGGEARYYVELTSKEDLEEAWKKAKELNVPFIVLGGGSNTIFADGTINALVVRIKADKTHVTLSSSKGGNTVEVEAGKNLPMLINELAKENLDLSQLTGIPGTIGGAIFGNAGQGPKGVWIDSFIESVTVFTNGEWKTLYNKECEFIYRESVFKKIHATIIWSATLNIPSHPAEEIQNEIENMLGRRLEAQPHAKTSGSIFKASGDTPAWKLIDAAGLRGKKFGGIEISDKHANFLLNDGSGTFADVEEAIQAIRNAVDEPLEVEMRLYSNNN